MSSGRVSVIIPTLNMGRFLPDALASIARQSRAVAEVIVIDSNSTDGTPDIVRRHILEGQPVRLLQTEAKKPAAARNVGLAAASGDFVAFLDADDLWPQNKLSSQLGYLEALPSKAMVTGFVTYFDVLDREKLAPAATARTETLFHVHLGACLYRHSALEAIGPFDEALVYSEDVDLLMRVREKGIPFTILRSVVLYYRRHPHSLMSQPDPRKERDFRRAVVRSLARRRAEGGDPVDLGSLESYLDPER